jgi:arginine/ornithine N-succinyltransferase beta subunit
MERSVTSRSFLQIFRAGPARRTQTDGIELLRSAAKPSMMVVQAGRMACLEAGLMAMALGHPK